MKAVIMAGGEGTRLRPLTCNIPKPMVPVANRPMMEHILNLLKQHQISEIANTLWYLPDNIRDYFGDGSNWDVHMEYFVEEQPLGTAGSVKNAQEFLTQTFVVVSGDSLTDIDLTKAMQYHLSKGALATIVLTKVSNPLDYGVVIIDDTGEIKQFLEKPSWSQVFSDTVNTGIYILEPEVLDLFDAEQKYDFSQDLFPKMLAQKAPLYGYVADGYWSDVGNLDVYRQSQQDCLDGKVKIRLPSPIKPGIWIEDEARVSTEAQLEGPVYIGRGSKIEAGAHIGPYTIVGNNSQVMAESSLKRSTLWQGVQIGSDCQVRGTILTNQVILEDRVQAFEGTVIGEKTRVGLKTIIAPNVKIWPAKQILSGSRLNQALVWGNQEDPSLFTATGIRGDIRGLLTPEMITKVGLAYGAFIGSEHSLLVTGDNTKVGRITKRALSAGLLSAGVNVLDGGTVSGSLTRFGIAYLSASGALHCQAVSERKNHLNIQCWDKSGYLISKGDQRRIENLFWRDDFPRPTCDDLGELSFIPNLIDQYLASVARIYQQRLQGIGVRVVAQGNQRSDLYQLLKGFFKKAGCNGESKHNCIQVAVDNDRWSLVDEQDRKVTEDQWWELFLRSLQQRQQKNAALPVHVSKSVAEWATGENVKVQWTKRDPRAWMEIASELGNTVTEPENKMEHFPYIEPLVSIAEVLAYLNDTKQTLHGIWDTTTLQRVDKDVFCPWSEKGRVMRNLINQADPKSSSFIDGLKQSSVKGWALVVPDGDDPVFTIQCESDSEEEADRLANYYQQRIEQIIGEGAH